MNRSKRLVWLGFSLLFSSTLALTPACSSSKSDSSPEPSSAVVGLSWKPLPRLGSLLGSLDPWTQSYLPECERIKLWYSTQVKGLLAQLKTLLGQASVAAADLAKFAETLEKAEKLAPPATTLPDPIAAAAMEYFAALVDLRQAIVQLAAANTEPLQATAGTRLENALSNYERSWQKVSTTCGP